MSASERHFFRTGAITAEGHCQLLGVRYRPSSCFADMLNSVFLRQNYAREMKADQALPRALLCAYAARCACTFRCRNSSHQWPVTFRRAPAAEAPLHLHSVGKPCEVHPMPRRPRGRCFARRRAVPPPHPHPAGRPRWLWTRTTRLKSRRPRPATIGHFMSLGFAFQVIFEVGADVDEAHLTCLEPSCHVGNCEEPSHLVALTNSNNLDPQAS